MRRFIAGLIVVAIFTSCKTDEEETYLFSKIPANQSNIYFSNDVEEAGEFNIIEYLYYYNGGGVAIGDLNNDGLDDIFFTSNSGSNKLYLNQGDFQFTDITNKAGVNKKGSWSTGVTMADINNDGYLDIYVAELGNYKHIKGYNKLFINNGDLTFSEKAEDYGLNFSGFSTQAAFFDKDLDGDLDLYLLNHSVHSVNSYGKSSLRHKVNEMAGDKIYENRIDQQEGFVDVTLNSGIHSSQIGYGLGLAVADIDSDGYPDVYISNDFHENDYLYLNNGDGTFREHTKEMLSYTSRYSMGNDIADVNNDHQPDIITLDMLPEDPEILLRSVSEDKQTVYDIKKSYGYEDQYVRNMLQVNHGEAFSDVGGLAGIHATDWSWAPLMADFNADGLKDIFISNGIYKRPNDLNYIQYLANRKHAAVTHPDSVAKVMIRQMPTLKIPNYLFLNRDSLQFKNVADSWGLSEPTYSNGAAYSDLDNDGDLDLVINNINQQASIYKNNQEKLLNNHYLKLKLKGVQHNRYGIGATVKIFYGGKSQSAEIYPTRGFQSAVPPYAYFGLGENDHVDSISIIWSRNNVQKIKDVSVDQTILIEEKGQEPFLKTKRKKLTFTTLPYKHQENLHFKDYQYEFLIPYKLSSEGPAVAVEDINGDKLSDIFLGGGRGQKSTLLLQLENGEISPLATPAIDADSTFEDVDAIFFDANGDYLIDLYVVSGGGDASDGDPSFQDRLYIQNKNGWQKEALPPLTSNGSVVKAADMDNDGDTDLFVGTRSLPGGYGYPASQYLLINDGKGNFSIATREKAPELVDFGMVTDAEWSDIDNDNDQDLLVVGDWLPVSIFLNENGKLIDKTKSFGTSELSGWWRSLTVEDLNKDGYDDLIVGNFGMNNKLKASPSTPVELYLSDFDDNGSPDPVVFYYQKGEKIPLAPKDMLANQMPAIKRVFTNYTSYSKVRSLNDLIKSYEKENVIKREAKTFKSGVLWNEEGKSFRWEPFSGKAQWSVINDVLVTDNGKLLVGGNSSANYVDIGNQMAFPGLLVIDEDSIHHSEFLNFYPREVKKLFTLSKAEGDDILIVNNNDSARVYRKNQVLKR